MRVNFELKQTHDYSIFNKAVNRTVEPRQVNKLVESISENGLQVPIVVTRDGKVVDGQHRLAALEQLNYPVPYLISTVWEEDEHTAVINNTQRSWNAVDWAEFRAKEGNKEIRNSLVFAKRLTEKAPQKLTLTTALEIIQDGAKAKLLTHLKNNTFKSNDANAVGVYTILTIMSKYPSSVNPFSQKMARAIKSLYVNRGGLNKKAIERMCAANYEFQIYNNEGQMTKYLDDLYKKYLVKSRV